MLDYAVARVLGEPRDPTKAKPKTRILSVNDAGTAFEFELRYEAGKTYCCAEAVCFVAPYRKKWWLELRQAIAEKTDRVPPPMGVTVTAAVEAGAHLLVLANIGVSTENKKSYGYSYPPEHEEKAK